MAKGKQKVIFTALTNGYDALKAPSVVDPDIDYIAYCDAPAVSLPAPWQYRPIAVRARNSRLVSRWYKLLPHRHLPEYRYSFWLDARCEITGSFSLLFDWFATTATLAAFPHPVRSCVYDEAEEVKRVGSDHTEIVDIQMDYYRRHGYPANNGLIAGGALFRAHGDEASMAAMEDWWQQIELFSERDQLSANFAVWRRELSWENIPGKLRENRLFRVNEHSAAAPFFAAETIDRPIDWLRHAAITGLRQPDR